MHLSSGEILCKSMETAEPAQAEAVGTSAVQVHYRPPRGQIIAPRNDRRKLPVIQLGGIRVHAVTEEACIRHVLDTLDGGRGGVVVTPNLDHLRRCLHDMRFGALVAEADLVVADGMPLVWASRLQGTPLPERVAGSDLISSLSAAATERGRSIFLLGGTPGSARAAAEVLARRHPELAITGTHCPPFGFEKDEIAIAEIISILSIADPNIVYVALGSPKQELLIERVRATLPDAWWLGVGNSFSFLAGDVKRAPLWMQKHGLEWVHRLVQEPKRLFRRYVVLGLPFAAALLGRSMVQGVPVRWRKRLRGKTRGAALPETVERNTGEASAPRVDLSAGADRVVRKKHPLRRLRSIILLGGALRPNPLSFATQRSVLNLPLGERESIVSRWLEQAADVARTAGLDTLPVRVVIDRLSRLPVVEPLRYEYGAVCVQRDPADFRGTGGVLADLAGEWADEDLILVVNAQQVLLEPLGELTEALHRTRGDVSLVVHGDGTPSGVMLLACGALRQVPTTGFVDLKEQGLPQIARRFDVTVLRRQHPTGLPVRSAGEYVAALRQYHLSRAGRHAVNDPLAEDWRPAFAIVEEGADVDPLARVHDSVVLRGRASRRARCWCGAWRAPAPWLAGIAFWWTRCLRPMSRAGGGQDDECGVPTVGPMEPLAAAGGDCHGRAGRRGDAECVGGHLSHRQRG